MEALPQCLQPSLIGADTFLISITPAAEVVAAQAADSRNQIW
jgi:hypothetical protein